MLFLINVIKDWWLTCHAVTCWTHLIFIPALVIIHHFIIAYLRDYIDYLHFFKTVLIKFDNTNRHIVHREKSDRRKTRFCVLFRSLFLHLASSWRGDLIRCVPLRTFFVPACCLFYQTLRKSWSLMARISSVIPAGFVCVKCTACRRCDDRRI